MLCRRARTGEQAGFVDGEETGKCVLCRELIMYAAEFARVEALWLTHDLSLQFLITHWRGQRKIIDHFLCLGWWYLQQACIAASKCLKQARRDLNTQLLLTWRITCSYLAQHDQELSRRTEARSYRRCNMLESISSESSCSACCAPSACKSTFEIHAHLFLFSVQREAHC